MMNEYCINGLTIKENLLRLAGEGNKKFTESLHPGIENVLGVRVPALRQLAAQIAKDDWQAYLQSADTFYMEERMLQGMVIGCLKIKDVEEYLSLVSGFVPLINTGLYVIPLTLRVSNGLLTGIRSVYGSFWKDGCSRIKNMKFVSGSLWRWRITLMRTIYRTYCNG